MRLCMRISAYTRIRTCICACTCAGATLSIHTDIHTCKCTCTSTCICTCTCTCASLQFYPRIQHIQYIHTVHTVQRVHTIHVVVAWLCRSRAVARCAPPLHPTARDVGRGVWCTRLVGSQVGRSVSGSVGSWNGWAGCDAWQAGARLGPPWKHGRPSMRTVHGKGEARGRRAGVWGHPGQSLPLKY